MHVDIIMPSPAIVSVQQVLRSLTATAAVCGKSLADLPTEGTWQQRRPLRQKEGKMKRKAK